MGLYDKRDLEYENPELSHVLLCLAYGAIFYAHNRLSQTSAITSTLSYHQPVNNQLRQHAGLLLSLQYFNEQFYINAIHKRKDQVGFAEYSFN